MLNHFGDILLDIKEQARALRLSQNLSQEGLAKRSGVSLASLKRFEASGKISLESLLKLAQVLGALEDFKSLFKAKELKSLDEIIDNDKRRERGMRK
ncbi:MAG: helix-turn-helix transcriptional regulator [Cyanobacteria bacterium]|nr:helix-turn-helix transcriptional regulator [Cyanobacteriota bacterium]MDA1020646.1 helix-turn-helix transcriptional regulator [Cyanobacteriota bacterium]